jgi:hypothetical protein
MVHALETIHGLLKKDGLLFDIHPSGRPPEVLVNRAGETHLAGHIQEIDDFVAYFQADDALKAVTDRGLFRLERQGQFTFLVHAPTIEALANYLETDWTDAILPEAVVEQIAELMDGPTEDEDSTGEIVVREIIRIARFRSS